MDYIEKIVELEACDSSINWLESHNFPTLQDAWNACERGDWMSWLIEHTMEEVGDMEQHEKLVLAFIECLGLCKEMIPEDLMERATETALASVRKEVSSEDVRSLISDVSAVWEAVYPREMDANDAVIAVLSISRWPDNCYNGTEVVNLISDVLDEDTPNVVTRRKCAEIFRKHFPNPPKL